MSVGWKLVIIAPAIKIVAIPPKGTISIHEIGYVFCKSVCTIINVAEIIFRYLQLQMTTRVKNYNKIHSLSPLMLTSIILT